MGKITLLLSILLLEFSFIHAQTDNGLMSLEESSNPKMREIIRIPNVKGYQTLKCDFHMHTVFSDGHVWPTVRVQEAWQEGMDAIAITDHIEYQPHSKDVATNHNRAFELAGGTAAEDNIVFIKGTEITRSTPPGHFNAIFIGDASGYMEDNASEKDKEAVLKAIQQDAFIFWNHPGWKATQIAGSYDWVDFVDGLHKENVLHGIEVFNGFQFHKKALDWCVDKGLTVMGSTDIHNLVAHEYHLGGYVHRSMTLVFAKDRTAAAIREALDAGRTVAWSSKYIAGKEEHVRNLFNACVEMGSSFHSETTKDKNGNEIVTNYFEIKNQSDLYFELELKSGDATQKLILYPGSSQIITAKDGQQSLVYEVPTAYIRSDKHLVVDFPLY